MKTFPNRRVLMDIVPKHTVGVEIGVAGGVFSQVLFNRIKPKRLYLVDTWQAEVGTPYAESGDTMGNASHKKMREWMLQVKKFALNKPQVVVIRQRSERVARMFDNGELDWLYLDACHLKECVERDFAAWWPKLKPGGLFMGHDYLRNKVRDHIKVKEALDPLMAAMGLKFLAMSNEGNASYVIRKPEGGSDW